MTDISKCEGHNCTLKELCYRYTSIADDDWQSYSNFQQDENLHCEFFIEDKNRKI
jgi:hypothetical protein